MPCLSSYCGLELGTTQARCVHGTRWNRFVMILDRTRRHRNTVWMLGCIFLFAWGLSLIIRGPYSGALHPGERAELVTADILFFVKNWWVQHPWSIGFTMPYFPYSVESSTLANRGELYNWYPPGVLGIPWLVAMISGQEPTLNSLTAVNLVEHLILIGALGFCAFYLSRFLRFSESVSGCLAVSVAILATFAPGALYWFLRLYIWDVNVVPLFAVFLLLEILSLARYRNDIESGRAPAIWDPYRTAQIVVAFLGMWTEWLFFFVYLVWGPVLALRLFQIRPQRRLIAPILVLLMPVFTFATIQVWRLQSSGFNLSAEWRRTLEHFLYRAGYIDQEAEVSPLLRMNLWLDKNYLGRSVSHQNAQLLSQIDQQYFHSILKLGSWGFLGPLLVGIAAFALISFLVLLARKGRPAFSSPLFGLSWMTVLAGLPVLIHFSVFRNHAAQHEFVAAKAVVPFALYLGCFVPAAFLLLLRKLTSLFDASRTFAATAAVLASLILVSTIAYALQWNESSPEFTGTFSGQIWSKDLPAFDPTLGTAIRNTTGFNDVVVSPDIEVPVLTYDLAYSMKIVRKLSGEQIERSIPASCPPRSLVVVSRQGELLQPDPVEQWSAGGLFFARYRARPGSCAAK
jgi:hypothetical protein